MATERGNLKGPEPADGQAEGQSTSTPQKGLLRQFFAKNWLLLVFVALISGVQGGAVAYHRWHLPPPEALPLSPEVPLGAYHFEADTSEGSHTARAEFSLCVALMEPGEQAARTCLTAHKFRVQQAIEELLRKAHGGDFEDPSLQDLKRQIQEQINQTLGMRAIADVILTDLKLRRNAASAKSSKAAIAAAESVPWQEGRLP